MPTRNESVDAGLATRILWREAAGAARRAVLRANEQARECMLVPLIGELAAPAADVLV